MIGSDSETMRQQLYNIVKLAVESGLSVWPPEQDGSKKPWGNEWKKQQATRTTVDELRTIYEDKALTGIGIVPGAVSGNVECLDFDERHTYDAFKREAVVVGLGPLIERIEAGYLEATPNGKHYLYKCCEISGNTKLATRPKRPEEKKDKHDKTKTLIETRGEGGYVIVAPTFGNVNADGSYTVVSGGLDTIVEITSEERQDLFSLARTFHIDAEEKVISDGERIRRESSKQGDRPGDDYNKRATWQEILETHGWTFVYSRGGVNYWRRPGKDRGISASTGYAGTDFFHNFSSSTPFELTRSYSKFSAFAILNHGGDFQAAAKELADKGYGGNGAKNKLSENSQVRGGQLDSSLPEPLSYLQKGSDLRQLNIVIEWVIFNLLPKQSITILYGPGGIGKTWLSLILSQAIAAMDNFMGLVAVTMPVVYIDFENPYPVLIDRVKRIGIDDVLFWHNSNEVQKPPRLDSDKWELYKTLPPGALLIFDTLRASQSKDENDSQHMAFVMQRLKEFRDLGFTILLLHHTPKGNDRTYKGSTAIIDLADHALSLHKVKKSNPEGGEIDDDDDHDCLYRLGTKNKTRYEPFHIFLSFDPEKGFIKSVDPDEADLLAIHEILTDRGSLNQQKLFEVVKTELDLKSKGKLVNLLRKGEGKFWHGQKEGRAFLYEVIPTVQLSDPYTFQSGQLVDLPQKQTVALSKTDRPDTVSDPSQTLDRSQLSSCPAVSQTVQTDEVIEVLEVIE